MILSDGGEVVLDADRVDLTKVKSIEALLLEKGFVQSEPQRRLRSSSIAGVADAALRAAIAGGDYPAREHWQALVHALEAHATEGTPAVVAEARAMKDRLTQKIKEVAADHGAEPEPMPTPRHTDPAPTPRHDEL